MFWLPSGWLGILPLGLAQNPTSKRRFIDDYEIVYAPSLEALASAHDAAGKSGPATLAAIVNPTGDLPGTEKEGEIVASHFAGAARVVLQGAAATGTLPRMAPSPGRTRAVPRSSCTISRR